jgi:hypothetical protein
MKIGCEWLVLGDDVLVAVRCQEKEGWEVRGRQGRSGPDIRAQPGMAVHKKRREGAGKSGVEPGDMEERFLTWLGMTK